MWLNQLYEYDHEYGRQQDVETIEMNDQYVTYRKPAWLVLLKVLGLALMVTAASGLIYPWLLHFLSPVQAGIALAGAMLIYSGLAFFIRPKPSTDYLDDYDALYEEPTILRKSVRLALRDYSILLGPGWFAAETLLDLCVLLGVAGGEEVIEDQGEESPAAAPEFAAAAVPYAETGILRPGRFDE
jgi:hypothetical protein